MFLASCGGPQDVASVDSGGTPSNGTAATSGPPRAVSRVLPVSEFRSRVERPEGLTLKPTPEQAAVVQGIEAAYAAVPQKDRTQVNMLMTCQAMIRGSMVPFNEKAAAIAAAFEKVRALPSAGTDCMSSSRRRAGAVSG